MDDVRQAFVMMSIQERQRFLAVFAHELTVLARTSFEDADVESARQCNEALHRVVGYLASSVGTEEAAIHDSFITMIAHIAETRGWSQILRESLRKRSPNTAGTP